MKTKLKPSLKEKKRYLLLEMQLNRNKKEILETIEKAILDFIGTLDYAKASPKILNIKQNNSTNKTEVILAVNRKELDKVRAALCLSKIQINVKKVSGSLRKLREIMIFSFIFSSF